MTVHHTETPDDADRRLVGNRYLVDEVIGQGGYGVVRRGHDVVLGREVAVKELRLPPSLPSHRASEARFRLLQEARAAAVLTNAHTITVYDIVEEDGGDLHVVMELVDGRTLTELVEADGRLRPGRAAGIGLQVLDALEAAHAKGIVHRDVKPANVMVMRDDRVKLGDFGLASLSDGFELTLTGEVVGTPSYMAPEQASGGDTTPPADLWALGATLYFAVEGVPPFGGGSSVSTMHLVVTEPPRPATRAGALRVVLDRLLVKEPEERPGTGELRALLAEVADGADDGGAPATPTAPAAAVPAAATLPGAQSGSGPARTREPSATRPAAAAPTGRAPDQRRGNGLVVGLLVALASLVAVLVAVVVLTRDATAPEEGSLLADPGVQALAVTPTPAPTPAPTTTAPATTVPTQPPAAVPTVAAPPTAPEVPEGAAPPAPPPPPPFTVEAASATNQGNLAGLPTGEGTIQLTTKVLDSAGRVVAGTTMAKFRSWDGNQVVAAPPPQFESFDDPGRGVTFLGVLEPVQHEASRGGRSHTSAAVAVFRACGEAGNCVDLRASVQIVARANGTFNTRRGPA